MAKEFKLPDLGEGIHEGEVLAVKVSPGQQVKEDDIILEVETDKAAVEIPSPYSDVVTDVKVESGDVVHVGDIMMVFGGTGDNVPKEKPKAEEAAPEKAPEEKQKERVERRKRGEPTAEPHREGPVPAAPSTRRLARELGVDLHEVTPTGPGGRVTKEDVRAHSEGREVEEEAVVEEERRERKLTGVSPQTVEVPPLPEYDRVGEVERVPLRSVRRATAKQMALSWSQVPHVTTQDLVDITELEKLRERYKDEVKEQGGALTLTVFVIKALTQALKEFPKFNASLDMESEEIVLKKYYNIGIAVDSERGLLVPSIRDADKKSIFELAVELRSLATRTREGHATLEDLQGSTMTITNVGAIGGTGFAPIINYPEAAILGLARASVQPVAKEVKFEEGEAPRAWGDRYEFVPRLMLPIVLSFDHRVNDGAEAQRFLNRIIELLENPERLLLGF
ncbi:MAG: 2-oxo acid dehydrogenase subunit E2 [Anaerolineae bacterium]|nr:2-oxo acid dehydrogenase subunit E2 [Anaerolineae bacterium]